MLHRKKEEATDELDKLKDQEEDIREQLARISGNLQTETKRLDEIRQNYSGALDAGAADVHLVKEKSADAQIKFQAAQEDAMSVLERVDDSERELLQMTEAHKILLQETMDEISKNLESEFSNIFSRLHNFSFIANTLTAVQKIASFPCCFRIPFPDEVRLFLRSFKMSK